jgi:pimeloyl-ACP methyl ester carboxylesterase
MLRREQPEVWVSRFEPGEGHVGPYAEVFARRRIGQLVAGDGTRVSYEVVGDGPEVLMLANGLGGRLYAWLPVIEAFMDRYRVITWDYRGLFESEAPSTLRNLSVRDHAEDMLAILDLEGVERAHFIGWSMGVQVCLEAHTLAPDRTLSLVLVNGTYGQVFSSALQPFLRFGWAPAVLHGLMELLSERPWLTDAMGKSGYFSARALFAVRKAVLPRVRSHFMLGLRQYASDLAGTDSASYFRLFQQIDAHSVYHLLPAVTAQTLVISGGLDLLTPADQSRRMARRIPGAKHKSFPLATHFVVLERPKAVVRVIAAHLASATRQDAGTRP